MTFFTLASLDEASSSNHTEQHAPSAEAQALLIDVHSRSSTPSSKCIIGRRQQKSSGRRPLSRAFFAVENTRQTHTVLLAPLQGANNE